MDQLLNGIIAKIVLGQIRHWVAVLGASLVTQGLLSQDQGNQLTGAIMVIVPLAFSAWDKLQAQKTQNAAILAAAKKETK